MSSDPTTLDPARDVDVDVDVDTEAEATTDTPDVSADQAAAEAQARRIRARRTIAIAAVAVLALWVVGTQVLPDRPSPDSAPAPTAPPAAATPADDTQRAPDQAVVKTADRFAEAYAAYLNDPDARAPYREFARDVAPALARAFTQAAKRMPEQPARSVDGLQLQALPDGQWRGTATLVQRDDLTESWPLTFTLADHDGHPMVVSLP
jgi:hypothetical protein